MADHKPIAFTAEGRPLFDNTPSVVCMIVENRQGQVLAVRRANDPGRGLLGLPGGYHMRGETWQEAGLREVFEETGITLRFTGDVGVNSVTTDECGSNVIIGTYGWPVNQRGKPLDGEALEIGWVGPTDLDPGDWAFPLHFAAVMDHLTVDR